MSIKINLDGERTWHGNISTIRDEACFTWCNELYVPREVAHKHLRELLEAFTIPDIRQGPGSSFSNPTRVLRIGKHGVLLRQTGGLDV